MFIEITWIMGQGASFRTENEQTVATWVYSMGVIMTLTGDLKKMGNTDEVKFDLIWNQS